MKTIRQLADEIGVSKQAVQKRIAREPLYTCIQPYISTKGGTKYIDVAGEKLIKQAFSENSYIQASDNQPTTVHADVYNPVHTPSDVENSLYELLKSELEIKNKQIDELNARLSEVSQALVTAQETAKAAQALHAGTIQTQLIDGRPSEQVKQKKRWPFWK